MKCVWEDLPTRKNCFTVRNAAMINLNTGKVVRDYTANTKINVVQKCNVSGKTYYRTSEAEHHNLNFAFEASAFGLPNEVAPSVPSIKSVSLDTAKKPVPLTTKPAPKINKVQKVAIPNDGEGARHKSWFSKLFRRNHGKNKNS